MPVHQGVIESGIRLVVVGSLPPHRDGIAGYVALLAPHLAARYPVLHVVPDDIADVTRAIAGDAMAETEYLQELQRFQHDLRLYHLGNSPAHRVCYAMAMRDPGIVVLHDLNLHGIWDTALDHPEYKAQLIRELGGAGALLAAQNETFGWKIDTTAPGMGLFNQLVARSKAIIVHSDHAEAAVRSVRGAAPVVKVPYPAGGQGRPDTDFSACLAGYDMAIALARTRLMAAWAVDGDWEFTPRRSLLRPELGVEAGQLWWMACMVPIQTHPERILGLAIPSAENWDRLHQDFGYTDIRILTLAQAEADRTERIHDLILIAGASHSIDESLVTVFRAINRHLKFGGLLIADLWSGPEHESLSADPSARMPIGRARVGRVLLECGFTLGVYQEWVLATGQIEWSVRAIKVSEFLAEPVLLAAPDEMRVPAGSPP